MLLSLRQAVMSYHFRVFLIMNIPMLRVDFNEMLEQDLVLLSVSDDRTDANNEKVHMTEGLKVAIYMDDTDEHGRPDVLIATGLVEANKCSGWGAHVKWCCRIDAVGIRHKSEIKEGGL